MKRSPQILLLFLTFLSLHAAGCGTRRPPLPPTERVRQRTELLSGIQRGNEIILSWPALQSNAPDSSVQSIRRIDIYRLAEKPDAPLPLTEEEFAARSTIIGSINYDEIKKAQGELTYADALELAGEPARLRYAIRYINAAGQRAAFSNFLLIEPAAIIAQPPKLIETGNEISETEITINWQPPNANIDGSTPVNLLGYNIYRMEESDTETGGTPLNATPLATPEYHDKTFTFGSGYRYVVRAVSLGTEGAQVESLDSNSIRLSPRDIFPPSPPEGISVAPERGSLSIFFPPNPEPDVVGYDIYRSTDENLPKESWKKLNPVPLTRPTFLDENVESGKRYYYYLRAIDRAGNVSAPSAVYSEVVP